MALPRLFRLYPTALGYILWLFTGGLLTGKGRFRIFQLAHEAPSLRSPLPKVDVMDLVGTGKELTLLELKGEPGNVTLLELAALACLAEQCRATNLFEFGTFDGRTALNLIAHSPAKAHLYTLDLPATQMGGTHFSILAHEEGFVNKAVSGARFQNTPYAKQITQLLGDSATFDLSSYFGTMDFVFIDASHAYDYVKSDTENAFRLLRSSGGLLVWHDYGSTDWPDVSRALHEYYRGDTRFRDLKAIDGCRLAMLRVIGKH